MDEIKEKFIHKYKNGIPQILRKNLIADIETPISSLLKISEKGLINWFDLDGSILENANLDGFIGSLSLDKRKILLINLVSSLN